MPDNLYLVIGIGLLFGLIVSFITTAITSGRDVWTHPRFRLVGILGSILTVVVIVVIGGFVRLPISPVLQIIISAGVFGLILRYVRDARR